MKNLFLSLALMSYAALAYSAPMLRSDGSSTVFPITEAVAEDFQRDVKGAVKVMVGISGTGGGFKKFCRGETEVQNASRPISEIERTACKNNKVNFLELPIAFDAMAIVANPKNDWISTITVEELKKIWEPTAQGKVMTWKQVNPTWPDRPLNLFGAGPDSGTFDYFTEAIVGKAKASRGDYTGSEDDNTLVQGISSDQNALGYVPLAYYELNASRLKILSVHGGAKAPVKAGVLPSAKTVMDGTYYPLARPVFIYVNGEAVKRKEVKDFVRFYLKHASELVPQVQYVQLPATAYEALLQRVEKHATGTAFGGHSVIGERIDVLLKRPLAP